MRAVIIIIIIIIIITITIVIVIVIIIIIIIIIVVVIFVVLLLLFTALGTHKCDWTKKQGNTDPISTKKQPTILWKSGLKSF